MSKLRLRRERKFYEEPPKPEDGAYKFRVELVEATGDRINHWPGGNGDDSSFYEHEEDEPEVAPEYCGTIQGLSLKEINKLVEKHNLNEKDVFLTAGLYEDHLCVEVVHIKKQTEQEQLQEYKDAHEEWARRKKANKKEELTSIQQQIESLQKRAEALK